VGKRIVVNAGLIETRVAVQDGNVLTELYAISNVPTVIWFDEHDTIVRPNGVAFGTDMFLAFTNVESQPHMDAVRRWVREGEAPITAEVAREAVGDLTEDEVRARLHFRIAVHARRAGDDDTARRHLVRAGELAPHDWTIRRAAMPLLGDDPFGEKFFAMAEEWEKAGKPYHGIPGVTATS